MFKKIFGDVDNIDLLIDFLSTVLDIPAKEILNVTILDNEIITDALNRKFSHLDLLIKTRQGFKYRNKGEKIW